MSDNDKIILRKFSQRKFIGKHDFELAEGGILVKTSEFGVTRKFAVQFESLGNEKTEITLYSKRLAWATFITTCLCLLFVAGWMATGKDANLMVFWGILAFSCGLILFLTWQKYLVYGGEHARIAFYADVPSREQLEAFIADIQETKNSYLLAKYAYS